jgi:hypothetical protein
MSSTESTLAPTNPRRRFNRRYATCSDSAIDLRGLKLTATVSSRYALLWFSCQPKEKWEIASLGPSAQRLECAWSTPFSKSSTALSLPQQPPILPLTFFHPANRRKS